MNKRDLMDCIKRAIKYSCKFIVVTIETRGSEAPEYIINPTENFVAKMDYYDKAYNDDLTLKSYDGIRIVDAYAGTLEEVMQGVKNYETYRKEDV